MLCLLLRSRSISAALKLTVLGVCLLPTLGSAMFGADAPPRANDWLCNPLQWSVEGQGKVIRAGRGASLAVLQTTPISKRVSVETDIELTKVVGKSWKVAGVVIVRDHRNFWHFAMVLPPDADKATPTCELCEMRDGIWLAQGYLQTVTRESKPNPSQLGQRYHLCIAMDPAGIEGVLADGKGHVVERICYAFSAEAVTSGRPGLKCEGFEATFSDVSATRSEPVPAAPPAVVPYHSDSFVKEVSGKKTGFFHVEKHGDVWWPIDPQGDGFVALGVDHAEFQGHWCEKLGYAPYGRKNAAKYASSASWADETLGRLRSWGFNLLGACCDPELNHRGLAHTVFGAFGSSVAGMGDAWDILPDEHVPCSAFPNVFHPDFEKFSPSSRRRGVCAARWRSLVVRLLSRQRTGVVGQQMGGQQSGYGTLQRHDAQVGRSYGQAGAPRFPCPTLQQRHRPLQ